MSVPGLSAGYVPNPTPRIPAKNPPMDADKQQYTPLSHHPKKHFKKVRVRGHVMGTPGKIPADVYAKVIAAKGRPKGSTAGDASGMQK